MRQIVPDIYMVEGLRADSGNVYLLVSGEGLTLVDSGLAGAADQIEAQLREGGYRLSDVRAIVLTHAHADHMGSVAELARRSGAQVLAHQEEIPYIEQAKSMPGASPFQRLMNWLSDRTIMKRSPCKVSRPLQDREVIEAPGGLQVLHAPGHTPGSIALYQPERRILFCGDVFFNKNPMTGKEGLQLSLPLFTLDMRQARESARKLAALPVEVLCFGHGEPISEGANEKTWALLRDRPD